MAMIFRTALAAAVDGLDDGDADSTGSGSTGSDAEYSGEWPAYAFPSGFPEYADGVIVYAESIISDDMLLLIEEVSRAYYSAYISGLESAGWKLIESEDGFDVYEHGQWMLGIMYAEDFGVCMFIFDMGEFFIESFEWPEDLPVPLPVYTDGEVGLVDVDLDHGWIAIVMDGTSQAAIDAYAQELEPLGWASDGEGAWTLETDGGIWEMTFDFNDGAAFITMFFWESPDGQ
jgi:hypothetical protein